MSVSTPEPTTTGREILDPRGHRSRLVEPREQTVTLVEHVLANRDSRAA